MRVYDRFYLRRRRNAGWLFPYEMGSMTLDNAVASGYGRVDNMLDKITAYTGASVKSRRALDFGCGWGRLSIPLAQRCERVYGVDASRAVLQKAESYASRAHVSNVEWFHTDSLSELSGQYDLLISTAVFQHIPVREGERLMALLIDGLRPGGVGGVQMVVRPSDPWRKLLRWMSRSPDSADSSHNRPKSRLQMLRQYRHMLMGAYSLNRLGGVLADRDVSLWQVEFARGATAHSFDTFTIFFAKNSLTQPGSSKTETAMLDARPDRACELAIEPSAAAETESASLASGASDLSDARDGHGA